jgi:hypothetical protein
MEGREASTVVGGGGCACGGCGQLAGMIRTSFIGADVGRRGIVAGRRDLKG